jgi:hypothetical protein
MPPDHLPDENISGMLFAVKPGRLAEPHIPARRPEHLFSLSHGHSWLTSALVDLWNTLPDPLAGIRARPYPGQFCQTGLHILALTNIIVHQTMLWSA